MISGAAARKRVAGLGGAGLVAGFLCFRGVRSSAAGGERGKNRVLTGEVSSSNGRRGLGQGVSDPHLPFALKELSGTKGGRGRRGNTATAEEKKTGRWSVLYGGGGSRVLTSRMLAIHFGEKSGSKRKRRVDCSQGSGVQQRRLIALGNESRL